MRSFDLQKWWSLDPAAEAASEDNPLTPLTPEQRRPGGPLLALAFGWGFPHHRPAGGRSAGEWRDLVGGPDLVFAARKRDQLCNRCAGGLHGVEDRLQQHPFCLERFTANWALSSQ